MEKTSCSEKTCKRCGWCCTSLGKEIGISSEEDEKLKKLVFEKSGVVYLRSLNRYFLAMLPETAEKLRKKAEELGVKAEILPNKLIYDKKNDKVIVYDYYLNHEICPFYDKKSKSCKVYDDRPLSCKKFPNIDNSQAKEVADFVKKNKISFEELSYKEAVEKVKKEIK
jgi:Fe-S-cluster containining protein